MSNNQKKDSLYKTPTNKNFGFTFTSVFSLIALYFLVFNYKIVYFTFFLLGAILFLITTLAKPASLTKLNLIWFKFGIFISKIVNPIILGVLFFVIFTPIAIWFKIIRRDVLNTQFNNESTYWSKKIKFKSSMSKQF